jgi:hypothetical protein
MSLNIRRARSDEAGLVLALIAELAEYEKLSHEVEATEVMIADALFGDNPRLYCAIAEWDGAPVAFAVWFVNFSTFSGRHGVYPCNGRCSTGTSRRSRSTSRSAL